MSDLNRVTRLSLRALQQWRSGLLLSMVVATSACSGGPPPKLYLLEAPIIEVGAANDSEPALLTSLGISPVELPGYASDPRIVSSSSDGTLSLDDVHRWAEEPEAAISRVLSDRLRARTGSTVLIEPWPRDYAPAARVEVIFDRLLREPLGGADMAGQILLLSGDGRRLLKAMPFQIIHYGRGVDKRVFFAAVAKGVDDIALMAVQALSELGVKS